MKKFIGLFLILGIGVALLTSCFKAKFYGDRTDIRGGTTFNITSSNGIPTNINYTITETQVVQGASFEIKASNAIPVQLKAPTNSWNVQITNPINVQLNQTGAIQANLTIANKFENTNFTATIALKLDPAVKSLFPSIIMITSAPIRLESGLINQIVHSYEMNTNSPGSWNKLNPTLYQNDLFPILILGICVVLGGLIGRSAAIGIEVLEQLKSGKAASLQKIGDAKGMLCLALYIVAMLCYTYAYAVFFQNVWWFLLWTSATTIIIGRMMFRQIVRDKNNNPYSISFEAICGVVGAALVPAFSRLISRDLLITSSENILPAITLFSFCLLAGMLGLEFIEGVIDAWRGIVAKLKSKRDCEERVKALEAENKSLRNTHGKMFLIKWFLDKVHRGITKILRDSNRKSGILLRKSKPQPPSGGSSSKP